MNKASQAQSKWSLLTPILLGLAFPALAAGYMGCKKNKPPPPLPSAAPAATPSAPLVLTPEDAGVDAPEDADADAKKVVGHYKPRSSLANCCAALSQNAQSAPNPLTKTYMLQAAGICSAMAAQGKSKNAAVGAIEGALKGAGLPSACR